MHRFWHVTRDLVAVPDGQRRWDRAFQLVMHWALADNAAAVPAPDKEASDADRTVCPCFDQSPTADPHD